MQLKRGVEQMLAEANAVIDTVAVHDAVDLLDDGAAEFVDIRELHEPWQGTIPGSIHAPRVGIPNVAHVAGGYAAWEAAGASGDRG